MFVGIEIGGTKLQFGVGPGDGTLADFKRLPVNVTGGADGIRQQILETVPQLVESALTRGTPVRGVAFGFGGPVDDATRRVLKSHQVEGWADFPLADWAEEHFHLPAILGNDCDVAGLAEALFGAGKGLSPIFYITIGSGIGGGLIIDGEIYRGCGRGAAEIGHVEINALWVSESGCGLHTTDTLEAHASGWAIAREADTLAWKGEGRGSILLGLVGGESQFITAQQVAEAATQGEDLAKQILKNAWSALAQAIRHVIALLCPRRIIIGGGVSLMGEELLFKPVRQMVAEHVFEPFADCFDIVPAALGEEVVVHGALALARKRLSKE